FFICVIFWEDASALFYDMLENCCVFHSSKIRERRIKSKVKTNKKMIRMRIFGRLTFSIQL
ncbi:hypothetical protein, partial [Epilithonimonas hominis]|uniref:hypothetical protein n=1 Tax=Epilithonimonas hominis TaxID=420404 RepID=UPI0028A65284